MSNRNAGRLALTVCLGLVTFALATAAVPADGKKQPEPKTGVDAGELLKFVCRNKEAWSPAPLPLYESVVNPRTKAERSAAVPAKQQNELKTAFALAARDGQWAERLPSLARITPLYLQISCKVTDRIAVKDVVEKFGEPEKKRKGAILNRDGQFTNGEWYIYGNVRLGVLTNGNVLSVQIDSDNWRRLSDEMDHQAAEPAKPKLAEAAKADPEELAAQKLALAKQLANSGLTEKAKTRYQEIVEKYPATKAAAEARELLEKLK